MKASILIVTRDRAADLDLTLKSMEGLIVPDGVEAEILVVDNGSKDATQEVVGKHAGGPIPVRSVIEPNAGKSNGLNTGLARSAGDVIIFTDDDVRPPADWIEGMCSPIASGRADAVAGGVKLAPNLLRPWMTKMHRTWLAATEWLAGGAPCGLVGANMAISRDVLKRVPAYDPELGGGALGFFEDVLFGAQVLAAGFRIHDGLDVCVEHHFDPSRLGRETWVAGAGKRGESHAYMGHHWEHWRGRFIRARLWREQTRLARWRSRNPDRMGGEGCSEEELQLIYNCGVLRGHLRESARPRNYEHHGLVKLRHG